MESIVFSVLGGVLGVVAAAEIVTAVSLAFYAVGYTKNDHSTRVLLNILFVGVMSFWVYLTNPVEGCAYTDRCAAYLSLLLGIVALLYIVLGRQILGIFWKNILKPHEKIRWRHYWLGGAFFLSCGLWGGIVFLQRIVERFKITVLASIFLTLFILLLPVIDFIAFRRESETGDTAALKVAVTLVRIVVGMTVAFLSIILIMGIFPGLFFEEFAIFSPFALAGTLFAACVVGWKVAFSKSSSYIAGALWIARKMSPILGTLFGLFRCKMILCTSCLRYTHPSRSHYEAGIRYCEHCQAEVEYTHERGKVCLLFGDVSIAPEGRVVCLVNPNFESKARLIDIAEVYIDAQSSNQRLIETFLTYAHNYPPKRGLHTVQIFLKDNSHHLGMSLTNALQNTFGRITKLSEFGIRAGDTYELESCNSHDHTDI